MTVYYSKKVEHTLDEPRKVRSFQAKDPIKVSNNFGKDIVVIETDKDPTSEE